MKSSELKQLIKEEIISILSEDVNYTPGGFMGDEKNPWKSFPSGRSNIYVFLSDEGSNIVYVIS